MDLKNILMTSLVIFSILLLSTTLSEATDLNSGQVQHITDPKQNYTISGDNVILHSYIGDIKIPIPENVKKAMRGENKKLVSKHISKRNIGFEPRRYINYYISAFPDFWECNEQAQIALSAYSENHRYWEAFFKRNSINNTISVRYCCNLLEYVDTAELSLSRECRDQVRLQDHVMIRPEIRYTCREYEFYNVQCFMVRWMYWWIPFILILLIILGIYFGCAAIRGRNNKSRINEEIQSLKEAKSYDDHNSNTLPYRPPYSISPLKRNNSATNKAFIHH